MPQLLADSFFIEMGLDATKFRREAAKVSEEFKKQQEGARKQAQQVEDFYKDIGIFLTRLTGQTLGFLGIAKIATDIAKYSVQATEATRATSQLAATTNISGREMEKWGHMAQLAGGDAKEAEQAVAQLSDQYALLRRYAPESGPMREGLNALEKAAQRYTGQMYNDYSTFDKMLETISKNVSLIASKDQAMAHQLLLQVTSSQSLYQLWQKGADEQARIASEAAKVGASFNEADIAARKMNESYQKLQQKQKEVGRELGAGVIDPLLTKWYDFQNAVLSRIVFEKLGQGEVAKRFGDVGPSGTAAGSRTLNTTGMDPNFAARLTKMLEAMPPELGGFKVGSGFRTHEEQARLYAERGSTGTVAPPGHSMHEIGEAGDLIFGTAAGKAWIHAHAHEFGLRFPMSYEPWHIQPSSIPPGAAVGASGGTTFNINGPLNVTANDSKSFAESLMGAGKKFMGTQEYNERLNNASNAQAGAQ